MKRREFLKNSALLGAMATFGGALNLNANSQNLKGEAMKFITLNDGNKMPILGYGVYQIPQNDTQRCVEDAISVGYRSIDTAQAYQNELGVGAALNSAIKGGIKREEFFITTKIWVSNATESGVLRSFEVSMKKLGLDYLDLLLIHQPFNDVYGAWRAMSRLKNEGRIKSIGVSNFYPDRLVDFALNNEIKPAVNQIELNVFHQRKIDRQTAAKFGTAVQSWASFGEGRNDMFNNPILKKIGEKYGKSVAQTILRYLIQLDIIVIPKTTRKNRMIENFSVFDFELSTNDMQTIANMDEQKSLFSEVYHNDPATVERLNGWKLPD